MSEQAESSTVRELRGYLHTLSALAQNYPLCGVDILLLADSLCSCWGFFKHGSQTVSSDGILLISDLCLSIFELSRAHGFRIHISWRRRDEVWSLGVDALLPLDDDCFFGDRFSTTVILVEVVAFPLARSVDRRIFDPRFLHSVARPCRLA